MQELMLLLIGNSFENCICKTKCSFLMLEMSDWIGCLLSNFNEWDCRIYSLKVLRFGISNIMGKLDSVSTISYAILYFYMV